MGYLAGRILISCMPWESLRVQGRRWEILLDLTPLCGHQFLKIFVINGQILFFFIEVHSSEVQGWTPLKPAK